MAITLRDLEVGGLWTTNGKDCWEIEGYFDGPSVTLKNLRTGVECTAGLGAPNLEKFVPLLPLINEVLKNADRNREGSE